MLSASAPVSSGTEESAMSGGNSRSDPISPDAICSSFQYAETTLKTTARAKSSLPSRLTQRCQRSGTQRAVIDNRPRRVAGVASTLSAAFAALAATMAPPCFNSGPASLGREVHSNHSSPPPSLTSSPPDGLDKPSCFALDRTLSGGMGSGDAFGTGVNPEPRRKHQRPHPPGDAAGGVREPRQFTARTVGDCAERAWTPRRPAALTRTPTG